MANFQHRDGAAGGGGGDQNFDYMFKILIIGNSSVGKTSFLFRYCDDSFTSAFVSTVGIDFKVKTVFRGEKRVKLQIWVSETQACPRTIWSISSSASGAYSRERERLSSSRIPSASSLAAPELWTSIRHGRSILLFQDTAGQERYRTITTAYYRGAMGFILMYDITNEESFNSVQDWYLHKH